MPAHPLGWEDGQLYIGFAHNTPGYSLPIFWRDHTGFSTLVTYFSKISEGFLVMSGVTPSNPFSLTKANDLSDDQIQELWVDIAPPDSPNSLFSAVKLSRPSADLIAMAVSAMMVSPDSGAASCHHIYHRNVDMEWYPAALRETIIPEKYSENRHLRDCLKPSERGFW